MKICPRCETEKPFTEFRVDKARTDGYTSACKACLSESYKKAYQEKYKPTVNKRAKRVRQEHRRMIAGLMEGKCCVRCGYDDPRAFEYHHRDPSQKSFTISSGHMRSNKAILEEIEKCDLLCANCHRIEHYTEMEGIVTAGSYPGLENQYSR